jgi:hypothetical protein
MRNETVRQLVTVATHSLDVGDRPLLRQLAAEVNLAEEAELWVLLWSQDDSAQTLRVNRTLTREFGARTCVWGQDLLAAHYPRLATALTQHSGVAAESTPHHKLYYFFHAALGIWRRTFGEWYPELRYWWRLEPDVMFSGPLGMLLDRADQHRADCLLPGPFIGQSKQPSYEHWRLNPEALADVPTDKRVWSLVSIGRYSRRMLDLMSTRWEAGAVGFEEITLPVTCLMAEGCELGHLGTWAQIRGAVSPTGGGNALLPARFRLSPSWSCDTYLEARLGATGEIWHPVKERGCVSDAITNLLVKKHGRRRTFAQETNA